MKYLTAINMAAWRIAKSTFLIVIIFPVAILAGVVGAIVDPDRCLDMIRDEWRSKDDT